ncbi:hypothetical protein GCM10009555_034220 [Acrocarpospora macrocephala]|uniref:Uncharacterized protein n=1 Tax=Acrocarpospora macrocephala TaxID=150177 RepID=A0A5M3WHP2_9ACTN|nr:hypothetical protein [Acrocarpospora macrocephala]GES06603.1 hypothetical protein Amac_001980 [Acrocarpospora macrocephala]
MTRYAIDQSRNALIATWSAGIGDTAITVAQLSTDIPADHALRLAKALSELSLACWRCYTHPASAADTLDVNSEGWRRQGERDAFATVLPALSSPNLSTQNSIIQSYIHVEECAHRVGRALHTINDDKLTAEVVTDVTAELAAAERAELGDLSGRARQAVILSREDASPVQVAQANVLLRKNPFGSDRLFTELDPAAAAIAAAHWLQAAADITSEHTGLAPTQIVAKADDIEALPQGTLSQILKLMELGAPPRQAAMTLIREALRVAEGETSSLATLKQRITATEELIETWKDRDPRLSPDSLGLRITTLDPTRPAANLLEDLLTGIRACCLIYREYSLDDLVDDDDPDNDKQELEDEIEAFLDWLRAEADDATHRLI